jgi:hypothetical protein
LTYIDSSKAIGALLETWHAAGKCAVTRVLCLEAAILHASLDGGGVSRDSSMMMTAAGRRAPPRLDVHFFCCLFLPTNDRGRRD